MAWHVLGPSFEATGAAAKLPSVHAAAAVCARRATRADETGSRSEGAVAAHAAALCAAAPGRVRLEVCDATIAPLRGGCVECVASVLQLCWLLRSYGVHETESVLLWCMALRELECALAAVCVAPIAPHMNQPVTLAQERMPWRDKLRCVDMAISWLDGSGKRAGCVALEVDGPMHFLPDATGALTVPNTTTVIRNCVYARAGLRVVSVRVGNDVGRGVPEIEKSEFREVLAAQLRTAGVPV